jgi:hypothetical protein
MFCAVHEIENCVTKKEIRMKEVESIADILSLYILLKNLYSYVTTLKNTQKFTNLSFMLIKSIFLPPSAERVNECSVQGMLGILTSEKSVFSLW